MTYDTINNSQTIAGNGEGTLLAGRYRIVRQLGSGGMGSVWLAEDTQLDNKLFAIKMLPSILVSNKRAYRQLKDEALVAMKLTHPNIVTLRAFEENNGNPFLVMDYVDGQTLDDYLAEKGKLSEDEVIRVLRPIAAALDYAHGEGVVHRDVKPANVMIRKDGHPFILDFGIAREIQETMTRVTGKLSSGTLLYMSPEQLHGAVPRKEQDIYSFAAMAYECLKGEPPFVRGQIEHQIDNDMPEPLVGRAVLSAPLAASIMSGLAKKPEDRPPTCAAVLDGDKDFSRRGSAVQRDVNGRAETVGLRVLTPSQETHDAAAYTHADYVRLMADAKVVQRHVASYSKDLDFLSDFQEMADDLVRAEVAAAERQWSLAAECYARIVQRGKTIKDAVARREAEAAEKARREAEEKARSEAAEKASLAVHDRVPLWEGGPYWATTNIGADKPEDHGYYFWWGDTTGYKRENDIWVASDGSSLDFAFSVEKTPTYSNGIADMHIKGWITRGKDKNSFWGALLGLRDDSILTSKHDAAHVHWGGDWRMPTRQELDDLCKRCDWTWTTRNCINGYIVRGRGDYIHNSIFLPAVGYGNGTSLRGTDSYGVYWSSVPNSDNYNSWSLYFFSSDCNTNYSFYRFYGRPIRPVQGFTK